jgi:MFS family permease
VLLSGVLTDVAGWRAIFSINLPVGAALAVAAIKVVPGDSTSARWRGLDLRGASLATLSLAAILYAVSQGAGAGWASPQTIALGSAGLVGLVAFAITEAGLEQPLLRVQRLADRAVGGGLLLMLIASAVLFGMFLLTSIYLQDVHGTSPLETGLAFLPVAVTTGVGAHLGSHLVPRLGLRVPMAVGFATTTLGMLLLASADGGTTYVISLLPGMLLAGLGLGVVLVGVAFSVLTGARDEESGMLSGLNTTGHEVGGAFGVAALVSIASSATTTGSGSMAAGGLSDAFLAAGVLAGVGALVAAILLPSARAFLPKLRLAPTPMLMH